jgi:hypothetical protein
MQKIIDDVEDLLLSVSEASKRSIKPPKQRAILSPRKPKTKSSKQPAIKSSNNATIESSGDDAIKSSNITTTQQTQNARGRKRRRSVPELEKERSPSPVESDVPDCDFEVNKFNKLSPEEVKKANILYKAIARSDSTHKIPEDSGFGNLMKKSYPWAPFPVESLPGWRANKSTSGVPQPSESDWFASWWDLASQRPTTARKSNKIVATGQRQEKFDKRAMKQLFLPFFAIFVIKIKWKGKIPARRQVGSGQVEDAEMEDAKVEDAEMEDAGEDSLSELDIDSDGQI